MDAVSIATIAPESLDLITRVLNRARSEEPRVPSAGAYRVAGTPEYDEADMDAIVMLIETARAIGPLVRWLTSDAPSDVSIERASELVGTLVLRFVVATRSLGASADVDAIARLLVDLVAASQFTPGPMLRHDEVQGLEPNSAESDEKVRSLVEELIESARLYYALVNSAHENANDVNELVSALDEYPNGN